MQHLSRSCTYFIATKPRDNIKNNLNFNRQHRVGVLRPVPQPGPYWDRSSALSFVGLDPSHRGDSL